MILILTHVVYITLRFLFFCTIRGNPASLRATCFRYSLVQMPFTLVPFQIQEAWIRAFLQLWDCTWFIPNRDHRIQMKKARLSQERNYNSLDLLLVGIAVNDAARQFSLSARFVEDSLICRFQNLVLLHRYSRAYKDTVQPSNKDICLLISPWYEVGLYDLANTCLIHL